MSAITDLVAQLADLLRGAAIPARADAKPAIEQHGRASGIVRAAEGVVQTIAARSEAR